MSRKRYSFDADSGLLVDGDGNSLGRVIAITVDDRPWERGVGGCGCSTALPSNGNVNVKDVKEETKARDGGAGETQISSKRPTASQLEREAINRCWDYYFEVFPSKRQRAIDSTSKRLLRNALKIVGEEATHRAILGLSRSPFHNGENDQRKKYLELRYALKGKQRDGETDAERIERAISWAAVHAPDASAGIDPERIDRWLEEVRYTLSLPHRPQKQRGKEAWQKLSEAGFKVVRLDRPPWARIAR